MFSDKKGSADHFHKHLRRYHRKECLAKRNTRKVASESDMDSDNDVQVSTDDERINESISVDLIVKYNIPPSTIEQPDFSHCMALVAQKIEMIIGALSENKIDFIII
jgi:hypothetical protein